MEGEGGTPGASACLARGRKTESERNRRMALRFDGAGAGGGGGMRGRRCFWSYARSSGDGVVGVSGRFTKTEVYPSAVRSNASSAATGTGEVGLCARVRTTSEGRRERRGDAVLETESRRRGESGAGDPGATDAAQVRMEAKAWGGRQCACVIL